MPTDTNAGIDDPGADQRRAPRLSARALRLTVTVLTVVLVLAAGTATWLWTKADAAEERQRERAAAATVASQFALRMDKVDGAKFEEYIKGVNELLTTKARTKNSQVLDALEQSYAAAKVKGEGQVLMTAVGDADSDSATVLVVHDASVSTSQGDIEHHYRWTVDVVKVDGTWLVDDFNPVN